jgi:O-antigen/teichoic acid export membrane protein
LIQRLRKEFSGATARNTLWMSLSQGGRICIQALYFVLIARSLGVSQYGAFMGVIALVAILSPYSGVGSLYLFVKEVVRDRTLFSEAWGMSLCVVSLSAPLLIAVVLIVSHFVLPRSVPLVLVVFIAISDLLLSKVLDSAATGFQAMEKLGKTGLINLALSGTRLLSVCLLRILYAHPRAQDWALFYMLSTAVAAFGSAAFLGVRFGRPAFPRRVHPQLLQGLYFAAGLSSQTIYNDIDKTMLTKLSNLQDVGTYSAAYRMVDVTFSPLGAMLAATLPRFFAHGTSGIGSSMRFGLRVLSRAAIYGTVAGLGLFICAPLLRVVLGSGYANSAEALRWLAPLLLFKSIHYFGGDTLTGAGLQATRCVIQAIVAGMNIVINLWIIPLYGWRGAAWSSLFCDGSLVVLYWATVFVLYQRSVRRQANEIALELK